MANPVSKILGNLTKKKEDKKEVKELVGDDLFLDEEELRKYKIKKIILNIITYTFLTITALFILLPFYWMFATALKSEAEIVAEAMGQVSFFLNHCNFQTLKKHSHAE